MVQNDTKPDRKLVRRASGPKMVQNGQGSLGTQNGPEWYKTRQGSGEESIGQHKTSK